MKCADCKYYKKNHKTKRNSSIGVCTIKKIIGKYGNDKVCKTYFELKEQKNE